MQMWITFEESSESLTCRVCSCGHFLKLLFEKVCLDHSRQNISDSVFYLIILIAQFLSQINTNHIRRKSSEKAKKIHGPSTTALLSC